MTKELELKLEVFSGPLDLLLHLIKKLEIDIYDIPIAKITEQYMQYITKMEEHQLEIAGEYIVMASTLMAIKSKMLIPIKEVEVEEELEEYEDPRQELVNQLLIYQKFQEASAYLDELQEEQLKYYSREAMDLTKFQKENLELPKDLIVIDDLKNIFENLLKSNLTEPTSIIKPDKETIQEAVSKLRDKLASVKKITFGDLFTHYQKSEVVVTFLAMLELIKSDYVKAEQKNPYDKIYLNLK